MSLDHSPLYWTAGALHKIRSADKMLRKAEDAAKACDDTPLMRDRIRDIIDALNDLRLAARHLERVMKDG